MSIQIKTVYRLEHKETAFECDTKKELLEHISFGITNIIEKIIEDKNIRGGDVNPYYKRALAQGLLDEREDLIDMLNMYTEAENIEDIGW